eukprot:g3552.t1
MSKKRIEFDILLLRVYASLFASLLILGRCSGEKKLPELPDESLIGNEKGALHIVTSTECIRKYFTFQAWAQKYSLDSLGQPGNYTRIISCDKPNDLTEEDLSYMDNLIVPDWSVHPINGDAYQAYNKPVGLMYWLAERKPTAEWTLILDPDMILRQRFLVKDFEVPPDFAVASDYSYLKGVMNELADRHLPNAVRRQDHFGGPIGRKADKAGAFYFIRTKALVKLAPLWLKFTEEVRMDSLAWKLTGDVYAKQGERPWISEMYGYIYAATVAGIRHKLEPTVQMYPGYAVKDIPLIVHYGLNHTLGDFWFDKHVHMNFDTTKCPPWDLSFNRPQEMDGGLFPHPPLPHEVKSKDARKMYGDLLLIEVINTINQALCKRHREHCPATDELIKECGKVDEIAEELSVEYENLHIQGVICHDDNIDCKTRLENNECESRWDYMNLECRASCNRCRTYTPKMLIERHDDDDKTQEETVDDMLKNKEEEAAFHEVMKQQKVFVTRGKVGFLTSKTTGDEKEAVDDIRTTTEVKDIIILEDSERIQNNSVNNEAEEIERCQQLDQASFFADKKCVELEQQGLVQFDRAASLKISLDDMPPREPPSGNGFYTFVAIAIFVGFTVVIIRSWPKQKQRTRTHKYH